MRALACVQQVHHRQRFVHPHQHFVAGLPLALGQGQVQATSAGPKCVAFKVALRGGQAATAHALNQGFIAAAVFDQIGNRADFQAVFARKNFQVGQARHAAVVVHDFADHRGRRQARHHRQITARFGVPCAHEHAAVLGLKWKNMARLHQVGRHRVARYGGLHGARTVGR